MRWSRLNFLDVFEDCTGGNQKFLTNEYLHAGEVAVVDQGQELIAGYVNEKDKVVKIDKPAVIFGDHTRILKYIDFPFVLGADGVKVLRAKLESDPKFLYYQLQTINLPDLGYSRHYKFLKESQLILPPLPTQQKIAAILDKADELRRKDQQLLAKYDELLQSIFYQMFGDPVKNSKKWKKKPLKEFGDIVTGNTPSREIVDYYGNFIEWIKTDNILLRDIYPTTAREYLSEKGVNVGRLAPVNSLLVTCIAGSETTIGNVSLLNRQVAFNQQINALIPSQKYQPLFMYFLLYYSKKLVQDSTTKGMKRIITKSVFEKLELIDVPLELQKQFVQLAKPALCGKDLINQQVKKSEALFQSLLQKAFKGELVS